MTDVLRDWTAGLATAPARSGLETSAGRLVVMPGLVQSRGLATKVYTQFAGNAELGLPTHSSLVLLFDEQTGSPIAVMDGSVLTIERTAATSAAATRVLADPGGTRMAVLGSGPQAEAHLRYLATVIDVQDIRVHARRPEAANAIAATHPAARPVATVAEAVTDADVVVCCTSSAQPLFDGGVIRPGAHVVSIGTGRELSEDLLDAASVFVEWSGAAEHPSPAGADELRGRPVTELGEVLLGRHPGRVSVHEVTVWKSTGLAVEDVATADVVHRAALAQEVGVLCPL